MTWTAGPVAPAQVPRDGISRRQRLALLAAIMGSFVTGLDATQVTRTHI